MLLRKLYSNLINLLIRTQKVDINQRSIEPIRFTVYSKEDYDKLFDEIKELSNSLSPEEIISKFDDKVNFQTTFAQVVSDLSREAFTVYRLRVPTKEEIVDEEKIASFSYPPEKYCHLQRCNREGQQVFYASGDPNTPFHELSKRDLEFGKSIGYLSTWRIKPKAKDILMQNIFYGLPTDGEDYSSVFAKFTQEKVHEFYKNVPDEPRGLIMYYLKKYQELFTADESYYYITSAIVHKYFVSFRDKKMVGKKILDLPIISYPSVAKYKKSVNFVIRKDFVDEYMELVSVEKVRINAINEDHVAYSGIKFGKPKRNKLIWKESKLVINKRTEDWAVLSENKEPSDKFLKIKADARILSRGDDKKFSLNEYLKEMRVDNFYLAQAIKEIPHNKYNEDPKTKSINESQMILFPVEGSIFVEDKSERKIIYLYGIPVSYSIGYF